MLAWMLQQRKSNLIGSLFFVVICFAIVPQIAVVSQDCVLFARPIRENITYGLEDVPEDEIYRAAKLASAHDFIMKLPNGYDTGVKRAGLVLKRVRCMSLP